MAKSAAQRKRDSRKSQAESEGSEVATNLWPTELEMLDKNRVFRGGYDRNEYIATLIRRDDERVLNEQGFIGECKFCLEPLPKGCGTKWKGRGECYLTIDVKKHAL